MKIKLVRGSSFTDFQTKNVFVSGKLYEVDEALGRDLLSRHENGAPYFRLMRDEDVVVKEPPKEEMELVRTKKGGVTVVRKTKAVSASASGELDTAEGVSIT